jgi:L-histidine N-alpha-methyltransferase
MHATTVLSALPEAALTPLGAEVYRGLSARPRSLSPWIFYDEEGSRLFEAITELPEYYVTRREHEILADHADEIVAAASGGRLTVCELGAGSGSKTGLLLQAAVRRQGSVDYRAIDVSATALDEAKRNLERELPGVAVHPIVADYTVGLGNLGDRLGGRRQPGERRLFLYIGSNIGNFEMPQALQILRDIRRQLAPRRCAAARRRPGEGSSDPASMPTTTPQASPQPSTRTSLHPDQSRAWAAISICSSSAISARWNEAHSRIEMHLGEP